MNNYLRNRQFYRHSQFGNGRCDVPDSFQLLHFRNCILIAKLVSQRKINGSTILFSADAFIVNLFNYGPTQGLKVRIVAA